MSEKSQIYIFNTENSPPSNDIKFNAFFMFHIFKQFVDLRRRRLQKLVEEKHGMPMWGGGDYRNWWRRSMACRWGEEAIKTNYLRSLFFTLDYLEIMSEIFEKFKIFF
jgi:hypothetical protein